MIVPKYVVHLMERSQYEYVECKKSPDFAAGYTIRIEKRTPYTQIETLRKEIDRLVGWANRAVPDTAFILSCPNKTHHTDQYAVVTIFDPVMQHSEKYIPERG